MSESEPPSIGSFLANEEEVKKRKTFLELDEADERALLAVHSLLARHEKEIVERFYEFLLSQEHTRAILAQPDLLPRLKDIQTRYFRELTRGSYDLGYFQDRLRVGLAHERIGLSPEWYLGAYKKYLEIVSEVLARELASEPERLARSTRALRKVIFLDMSLAIDAYTLAAQERLAQKAAELERANRELRRLDAGKRRLTDMIVHDLQNPLAGITAFLQLLEQRSPALGEEERRALREALARSNDFSQLILNVLQISRAEEGKLDLYIETVDLVELARQTVEAFLVVAEQGGRSLELDAPRTPVALRTDQSLFRRILFNLVRNALRHTPSGTRVEVKVRSGPPAAVAVSDDGPGIPLAVQARIFEPGALREAGLQVDSGLGLAFCRMASQAIGWTLRLENQPEGGASFVLVQGLEEKDASAAGDRRET
jgi:signal transduction histidine kinase